MPSVIWLPMSRTKFRIIRGPNCCEARVSARMVMENTTPTTVMTAAAMAMSTCRSASALPVRIHDGRVRWWWYAARSIENVTTKSRIDTTIRRLGTTQNVVRYSSQRQLGSCRRSLATRGWTWTTSSISAMTGQPVPARSPRTRRGPTTRRGPRRTPLAGTHDGSHRVGHGRQISRSPTSLPGTPPNCRDDVTRRPFLARTPFRRAPLAPETDGPVRPLSPLGPLSPLSPLTPTPTRRRPRAAWRRPPAARRRPAASAPSPSPSQ